MSYLPAGGVLAVLMLAEYSFELGLAKRVSPLSLVTNPATLFFTAMDVFSPVAWFYFVRNEQVMLGNEVLLLGLAIEHIIEGATLKPQQTAPASYMMSSLN